MVWYISIFGFIQMITLYVIGCNYISNFWKRLRFWHKILLIGVSLDIILWKLFF